MMRKVVKDVNSKSTFSVLTRFLISSSQERDRKKVQDILENREKCLKDEMKKSKKLLQNELEEEKGKVEKVKKDCHDLIKERDLKEKNLEVELELENLREEYEEKLTRVSELMDMKMYMASVEKKELEDEMRKQSEMNESLKEELEKLKESKTTETYEVLQQELDSMKSKLSLASMEKGKLEDEIIRRRDSYENRVGMYENSWRVEVEKNCELENKLSQASAEKLQLDEKLRIARNLEEELTKSRMNLWEEIEVLKEKIQVLEGENVNLNQKLELCTEKLCKMRDFAEQIRGVCDLSINGNVRATGPSNSVSDIVNLSPLHSHGKASNVEGRHNNSPIFYGKPPSTTPLQAESESQQGKTIDILLGASNVESRRNNSPISSGELPSAAPLQAESESQEGKYIDILLGEKSGCLSIQNELEDGGCEENISTSNCKRKRASTDVD